MLESGAISNKGFGKYFARRRGLSFGKRGSKIFSVGLRARGAMRQAAGESISGCLPRA